MKYNLKGKKVAILVAQGFEQSELEQPLQAFNGKCFVIDYNGSHHRVHEFVLDGISRLILFSGEFT